MSESARRIAKGASRDAREAVCASGTQRRKHAAGPIALLTVWLMVSGALALANGVVSVSRSTQILWLSMMLTALGAIVAVLAARPATLPASLSQLELGPWIAVGFSVVFGLSTLVWRSPVTGSMNVVDLDFLVPAGALAAAGLLSLLFGYVVSPKAWRAAVARVDGELRGKAPLHPSALAVLVLWSTSLLATALQVRVGSFGYLSDPSKALQATGSITAVLAVLSDLGLVATLLAAWRHGRSPSAGTRVMLGVVLGSQIILGLFAAQKESVIIQLVALFIGYGCWNRFRIVPVVLGGAAVVLFVFPFVSQYRDEVATDSGRLSPASVVANINFTRLAGSAFGTSTSDSSDTASARLTRIGDLAVIIQKTPSAVPYKPATDLAAGPFLGFIPRSLWRDKPVLDAGYQMSSVYYGLPTSIQSSSALTPYGDLWRHGGLVTVLIGMALLGVLARVVDARSGDHRQDPRILFLPMLLFAPLVKQETDYLGFTASLVSIFLVSALASRMVTQTSPALKK